MTTRTERKPGRYIAAPVRYEWRPGGGRFGVPAAVAGAAVEAVRAANGGAVTPAALVDAARHPDAPLHPAFEWDDTVAAEKYRREQARGILRSLELVVEKKGPAGGPPVRQIAFACVDAPATGRAYLATAEIVAAPDLRRQLIADALALFEGARRRFVHVSEELTPVFAAVDEVRRRFATEEGPTGAGEPHRG